MCLVTYIDQFGLSCGGCRLATHEPILTTLIEFVSDMITLLAAELFSIDKFQYMQFSFL